MQRYGDFRLIPNNLPNSSSICYDSLPILRQTAQTAHNPVVNRTQVTPVSVQAQRLDLLYIHEKSFYPTIPAMI